MAYELRNRAGLMASFSQGELIEQLKGEYGSLQEDRECVELIQGGICYMLSLEWLRQLKSVEPALIYDSNFSDAKVRAYYKQIANNYREYSKGFSDKFADRTNMSKNAYEKLRELDERYAELCSVQKYTVKENEGPFHKSKKENPAQGKMITNLTNKSISGGHAILIYLNVHEQAGRAAFGHEMAIWCQHENSQKYYFFDPNFGVFEVDDLASLFADIFSEYAGNGDADIVLSEIVKK